MAARPGPEAEFIVVTVQTADDLTPEKQTALQHALELAEDLGATIVTLRGATSPRHWQLSRRSSG